MAVDVIIGGKPKWNTQDYSVAEDAVPLDPSNTSAGTGQFTLSLPESQESKFWRKKEVVLSDGSQGTTVGTVSGVTGDGTTSQVTVDSRMNALTVTRTAQPYTGTLGGAFTYYLSLVGLTSDIVIDPQVTSRAVVFPGWQGVVWDQVKALCSTYQLETALVSNKIVLRPVRGRTAVNYRDSAVTWAIDDSNIAQSVEIYYQNSRSGLGLVYPLGGWNSDVQAYQVDAGATIAFDISLDPSDSGDDDTTLGASLRKVDQPTCVASVSRDYSASSVYTVAGSDGLPISPAQWAAQGGSVSVTINEDTRSLTLTITGASGSQYAPYTIGMSSGDNTYYSSLRLTGDAVFTDRSKVTLLTGNDADVAPTEVGATIESPFIRTYEDAFRAGMWALSAWTGPKRTLSVTTGGINRVGEKNSEAQLTMGEFNALAAFVGDTMAQFNASQAGDSMGDLGAELRAPVLARFSSQAFGNVAGARVYNDGSQYRVTSVSSITPTAVSYTAEADDIMGDFNDAYEEFTAADFNDLHRGKTAGDFNARPALAKDVVAVPIRTPEGPVVARIDLMPSLTLYPAAPTRS